MGQIKTTYVKNLARDLVEKYPDKFTDSFEKNKKALEELVELESKKVRNLIAGYLVRLKGETKIFEAPRQVEISKRRGRGRGRRRRGRRRR